MLTVDIVEEPTGGRAAERWQLALPAERLTLRELICRVSGPGGERALASFSRNGFVVLVGDRQFEELDEVLELRAGTEVTFLRLIPLVGG